jgi:chorismate mutase
MSCRGVRGAITVDQNTTQAIVAATHELLQALVAANGLRPEEIASVIFTATPDLDAAHPARAAREMGWVDTPLLCLQEMAVAGGLPRCIRVLVHWNTDLPAGRIHHVYLREARVLRPDLVEERGV